MPTKFDKFSKAPKNGPSDAEKGLLNMAFGDRVCDNGVVEQSVNIFLVAIVLTVIFILLWIKPVDNLFAVTIPDYNYRLVAKAAIFFVIVYLLDTSVKSWRDTKNFCK